MAQDNKIKSMKRKKRNAPKWLFSLIGWSIGKERDYLVENLAMLLGSGMEVLLALETIRSEIRSPMLRKIILKTGQDVEEGSALWQALSDSNLFPDYIVALIHIGEETGQLNEKLKLIADQQKRQRLLRSRITSALSYPILIILLTFSVAIGISAFVLPRFVSLFGEMNKDLPLLTKGLVWSGNFFMLYGWLAVPLIFFIMAVAIFFVFVFPRTKFIGQWIFFHFPITNKMVQEIELSRFGSNLGTLLTAGLPLVMAMKAVVRSSNYYNYKKLYAFLAANIEDGQTFKESFDGFKNSRKLIPVSIQQMISSSEYSGNLAEILVNIGNIYDAKTEISAKNLTTMIEPIMLIIIGLGILGVALAIITPIYTLMSTMG
jgi:type IV pilus assembly protein PilC